MQKSLAFLFLILLLASCNVSRVVKDGKSAFDLKQYPRAIELLTQEYNEEDDKKAKAEKAFMLAQAYEFNLQPQNSPSWYESADQLGYGITAKVASGYAYKSVGDYQKSLSIFKSLSKYPTLNQETQKEIRLLESLIKTKANLPYSYKLLKISGESKASMYSSTFINDDEIVVTSDGPEATGDGVYQWTNRKHSDLFIVSKFGGKMRSLGTSINTPANEGTAVFNKAKTEVFFTRCFNPNPNADEYCKIFNSILKNEVWSEPEPLPFLKDNYNYGQPTLVEGDSVLIFTARSREGQNGYDLWYTDRFDGQWSEPEPMPQNINTQGNEYFPTADGDTLYFSSNFHPGLGGLDIFKTWLSEGKWVNPQRLEEPINSPQDDHSFVIDKSFRPQGYTLARYYFTSNRSGLGVDDLYQAEKVSKSTVNIPTPKDTTIVVPPPITKAPETPVTKEPSVEAPFQVYLAGRVVDASTKNNSFFRTKTIPRAKVIWKLKDTVVQNFVGDKNGLFIRNGQSNKVYEFIVAADSFLTKSVIVSTQNLKKDPESEFITVNFEVALEKIVRDQEIVLNNIYYDLDEDLIRDDAKPTLDSLANILRINPTIQIELGSHTDCRGDDEYNLALSQRRAQSAIEYLKIKGIASERLSAKGYGETVFAVECDCLLCTETQHQRNRRTSFKIK